MRVSDLIFQARKASVLKTACFLVFVLLISSGVTFAQKSSFKPEWNFGVNAGVTASSIDLEPHIQTKLMNGNTGGFSVRYISEKNLGLQGEFNYSQQGFKEDFVETDSIYSYSRNLNYMEVPIMTHIYFGNKVRFVLNLGPKISFMTSNKEKMNTALSELIASGDTTTFSVYEHFGKSIQRKFDYGLIAGTGVEFRSAIGYFVLEARYYFGLGDIFNNSKKDYFSRSANRVLSFKLTYFIKPFGKK